MTTFVTVLFASAFFFAMLSARLGPIRNRPTLNEAFRMLNHTPSCTTLEKTPKDKRRPKLLELSLCEIHHSPFSFSQTMNEKS